MTTSEDPTAILDFVTDILSGFEDRNAPFYLHSVAQQIHSKSSEAGLSPAQLSALYSELAVFEFDTRNGKESVWGTFYGPMFEHTRDDGSKEEYPNLSKLDQKSLLIWERRASTVTHPVLRARYADIIWDLEHKICPKNRSQFQLGVVAIDAYIEAAKNPTSFCHEMQRLMSLERALMIATELNDAQRAREIADLVLEASESASLQSIGIWTVPSRSFTHCKLVTDAQTKRTIDQLEMRLSAAEQASNGFAAEAACKSLLRVYPKDFRAADRKRVLISFSRTFEKQAASTSAAVAIAWLSNVALRLENEGLAEEAETIRVQIERLGPQSLREMHTQEFTLEFDRQSVNAQLERVISAEHPFIALYRLSKSLLPKPKRLRKQVINYAKQFVFMNLFSTTIIGNDGLPKATIGPADQDPDGRLVHQATQELGLTAQFFRLGYGLCQGKFGFECKDLVEMIRGSFLTSASSDALIEQGLVAHHELDYVKSINCLVPQIESMLRELLQLLGIPKTKAKRGSIELKNMNDVLSDLRIVQTLDEDLLLFLKILYIDKRGYNIRNEIAHGLASAESYNEGISCLVIMSLLLLSMIRPNAIHLAAPRKRKRASISDPQA